MRFYLHIVNVILLLILLWTNEVKTAPTSARPKPVKESDVFDKCSSDFLWRALQSTAKGNDSAHHFLLSAIAELGFTPSGIKARSAAAAWQKQIRRISSKSVFSKLQAFSATQLNNTSCDFQCNTTSTSTEVPLPKEEPKEMTTLQPTTSTIAADSVFSSLKNRKTGIKKMVKRISRLFEDDLSISKVKKKRKALRRMLNTFLRELELNCGYETTTTTTTSITTTQPPIIIQMPLITRQKKKKKKKHQSENALKVCILMIKELVEMGVCEEVEESFRWAFTNVQNKYVYDLEETFTKAVIVPVSEKNRG